MGWKWGNFSKYGDPDIIGAVKEFHLHQNSIFKHDDDSGKTQTSQTMFDLLKRDKNEDILPTDLPLNDNWTINVYALFDVDTWQVRNDLFRTIREFQIWEKTYTFIDVHSLEKNSYFLVDTPHKTSFPGLERWFDGYLYDVFSFGQQEVVVISPAWWSIDKHYAVDSAWQKIIENAVSIGKIDDHWLEVDLLKIKKFTGSQSLSTYMMYLWSDGNKYQKNHSGEFEIIG